MITEDQFELIDAALDVYLMKQNEGRGNPLLNRQAGRLLRDLKIMMENKWTATELTTSIKSKI